MKSIGKSHKHTVVASQLNKEREYWLDRLAGAPVKSGFLYDYQPKPGERSPGSVQFQLTGDIYGKLMKLGGGSDRKLYMILVTALTLLVHRYTSNTDIILGAPVLKQETEIEFINTVLILRNKIEKSMTCKDLLLQVRQTIIEAAQHQNYPVETLPDQLNMTYSEMDGFPLLDIALLVENIHDKKYIQHIEPKVIFSFLDIDNQVKGEVEFDTLMYNPRTIERIIRHFRNLLEDFLNDVNRRVPELEMLSKQEKQKLLIEFNNTLTNYSHSTNKTVNQLVEEQAAKEPDRAAIVDSDGSRVITSGELNRRVEILARLLESKRVQPDCLVGIMMERSITMLIGILGILKAGGAYLPIDINFPTERVQYILKDSGAEVLIIKKELGLTLDLNGKEMIDPFNNSIYQGNGSFPTTPPHPGHLLYVIYTSGSTGKPKGVPVDHRSVMNLLLGLDKVYPLERTGAYLLKTSYMFDVSVTELFGFFWRGGRLVVLEAGGEKDAEKILDAVENHWVTHINFVPSMFNGFVDFLNRQNIDRLSGLRYIFLAGEALLPPLVDRFRKLESNIPLENIYGPTEAAVYASRYPLSEWNGGDSVPIGKPLQNVRLYILNHDNMLQPVGVGGELCITGVGLALDTLTTRD